MKNADYIYDFIIENTGELLAKKAQVGVDLTINSISKIDGGATIYADPKKPSHGATSPIDLSLNPEGIKSWELTPGIYDIYFDQGLKQLPPTITAFVWQRSSLGRNGSRIVSSVYDPGFHTNKMGAQLYVHAPICIQEHARVAQLLFFENDEAEEYNGQYQGK